MEKISFWKLITSSDIKKICIPTIQRDYALGRHDRAFNRQNFLTALKKAVCEDKTLSLDFVYGVENKTMFVPLDGQQRLTTLWLLHWFVVYKLGKLSNTEIRDTLMKFSYETRISSRDFCKSLCRLPPNVDKKPLRDWIIQQTWFFHQYKQDPTIMGMLNMIAGTKIADKKGCDIIDGFEEVFNDEDDYKAIWERLTTTMCIQFNKLKVSLNDSDELYVKMNARGKQLTDFENFKTELVQHVTESGLLDEKKVLGLAAKLDVQWTDIFWKNRWEDEKTKDVSIDEIYFAFIRRFVRLECIKKQGDKSNLLKKYSRTFTNFEPYKTILDKQTIQEFIVIMDNLRAEALSGKALDTQSPWRESYEFIPKYINNNKADITEDKNTQSLLFYGYCRYFLHGKYEENSFKEWSRVLWNICENRVDKSNYKPTISEIDMLAPHSHNILDYLSNEFVVDDKKANSEQLKEEQCKARHLKSYPAIKEMEGYLFFKGAIRFLYTNDDYKEDWNSFDIKVKNTKVLIPENKEDRHTIKLLVPYIPKDSLINIFHTYYASNNDGDLRYILLYDKSIPYIHNFLLQNDVKAPLTQLHKDITEICERAYGGKGYLQTNWRNEGDFIWTNYEQRRGYYNRYSYVIGDEIHNRITEILKDSGAFSLNEDQLKYHAGKFLRGLYILFKYKGYYFALYGNNTICLMTDNWEEKMPNTNDSKGFCFSVENTLTEEQLIDQINNILKVYSENALTVTEQDIHSQS
jgi:hypothetical protein